MRNLWITLSRHLPAHTLTCMRWDSLFEGLESLWASEDHAAHIDEERDRARAERSTVTLAARLQVRAGESAVTISTDAADYRIHCVRIGADWVEGSMCSSPTRLVVPMNSVRSVVNAPSCTCVAPPCHTVALLELSTVLRFLERKGAWVRVDGTNQVCTGRITAVWADAITVEGTQSRDIARCAISAVVYSA